MTIIQMGSVQVIAHVPGINPVLTTKELVNKIAHVNATWGVKRMSAIAETMKTVVADGKTIARSCSV